MNLAAALLIANTVYLLLGLSAFCYVEHLDTRILIADAKIVKRQEMFDWGVKYQIAHDGHRQRQRDQWTVLFFGILVLGALAAVHLLYEQRFGPAFREGLIVYLLSLGAADLGIYLSVKEQSRLRKSRLRILKMNIVRAYSTKNYLSVKDLSAKVAGRAALLAEPFMMILAIVIMALAFTGVAVLVLT